MFLAAREQGEAALTPEQIVRLRMRTMKEASVVMHEFLRTFVEPQIRNCQAAEWGQQAGEPTGSQGAESRPLFDVFDEWAADDKAPPVVFIAPGGFGKTTVTLVLTARMVEAMNPESSELVLRKVVRVGAHLA